jgi:YD repeat-containing protein
MRLPLRSWATTLQSMGFRKRKHANEHPVKRFAIETLEDRRLFIAHPYRDLGNDTIEHTVGDISITSADNVTTYAGHNPLNQSYNSGTDPHPIVVDEAAPLGGFQPQIPTANGPTEIRVKFGGVSSPSTFFDTSHTTGGVWVNVQYQADASSLSSGRYKWDVQYLAYNGTTVSMQDTPIWDGQYQTIVNRDNSVFGRGWWLDELDQLVIQTGHDDHQLDGIALIRGTNQTVWFQDNFDGTYTSEEGGDGHFNSGDLTASTLEQNSDNTYTLIANDGGREIFDSTGLLTKRTDRNGNNVTYNYTDGNLTEIVDDGGGVTIFGYTGAKVTSRTDFSGTDRQQTTTFGYTGDYLTTVTEPDPDGPGPLTSPIWHYGYSSSNNLMTSSLDPNQNEIDIAYDFALKVHTVTQGASIETINAFYSSVMFNLNVTGYDINNYAPDPATYGSNQLKEDDIDPLGNHTYVLRNTLGQVAQVTDALGNMSTYSHLESGQLSQIHQPDPDGSGPLADLITGFDYNQNGVFVGSGTTDGVVADGYKADVWTVDPTFGQPTSYQDTDASLVHYVSSWSTLDSNGNILSTTQILHFDDRDYPSESNDPKTTYTYTTASDHTTYGEPIGLVKTVTDPLRIGREITSLCLAACYIERR